MIIQVESWWYHSIDISGMGCGTIMYCPYIPHFACCPQTQVPRGGALRQGTRARLNFTMRISLTCNTVEVLQRPRSPDAEFCTHIIMQSSPSWKSDVKGKEEQKASKDKLSLWWQIFFNSFSDEEISCRHYCPHADSTNLKAHTYLHLPRLRLSLLLNSPCSPFTHYFPIMGSSQHP